MCQASVQKSELQIDQKVIQRAADALHKVLEVGPGKVVVGRGDKQDGVGSVRIERPQPVSGESLSEFVYTIGLAFTVITGSSLLRLDF